MGGAKASKLDITEVRGSGTRDMSHLRAVVTRGVTQIVQPVMSLAAYNQLVANKALAGAQIGKDRGTLQSTMLDDIVAHPEGREAAAHFIVAHRAFAAACGLSPTAYDTALINDFLNFNGGRTDKEKKTDGPEWQTEASKKTGDHENGGYHVDNKTEGSTHRLLGYYTQGDKRGSFRARRGEAEIVIYVARGCALLCSSEVLAMEHAHGIDGRCISIVSEIALPAEVVVIGAPTAAVLAANAAQPSLPLDKDFGLWMPWLWFKGAVLKWGAGGGGTQGRMVARKLRGPKVGKGGRRLMTKRQMREARAALDDDGLAEAAAVVARKMGT